MTPLPKFRYLIYVPDASSVNVINDWGIDNSLTTTDIDIALSQPFSVAAVRVMFNKPNVFNYTPALSAIDLSKFDLVILSDIEYSQICEIKIWAEQNQIVNYVVALGGLNHNEQLDKTCMVYRPWWAYNLLRHNPVYQDTHAAEKPYLFEALLGARRPHRDYVMMALDKIGLLDRSLVTYRDCFPYGVINKMSERFQKIFYDTPLQWPYVSPNLKPEWEVRDSITNTVSSIMPYGIYQQTYYSIVCETQGTGNEFFMSEKITKCLLAGRIFVLFGPANFISKLHELGFRTWSSLLDESYDTEQIDEVRFEKAMQQVMKLAWFKDPKNVRLQIADVLKHNRVRFASLEEEYKQKMHDLLYAHIPKHHWLF